MMGRTHATSGVALALALAGTADAAVHTLSVAKAVTGPVEVAYYAVAAVLAMGFGGPIRPLVKKLPLVLVAWFGAWLGAAYLFKPKADAWVAGFHSGSILEWKAQVFMVVAACGAAMLSDFDHYHATIAQSLGPVTKLLARVVGWCFGGHRNGTHSFFGILFFTVLTAVLATLHPSDMRPLQLGLMR